MKPLLSSSTPAAHFAGVVAFADGYVAGHMSLSHVRLVATGELGTRSVAR